MVGLYGVKVAVRPGGRHVRPSSITKHLDGPSKDRYLPWSRAIVERYFGRTRMLFADENGSIT